MEGIGEVLTVFLVLSVVFEVAFTPIFNWRLFLKHVEGKGWKIPIVVGLSFLVFWNYELDIVKDLLVALNKEVNAEQGGRFLSALLIAGGSDGVLRIFRKLGIRMKDEERLIRTQQARGEITTEQMKEKLRNLP